MSISIRLTADGHLLEGVLYTTITALQIAKRLPLELELERWGDEYHGDVGKPLGAWLEPDNARTEMKPGELAWRPPGNALCIFFGRTPASVKDEPRAASEVNPIGRLSGDFSVLQGLGERIRLRIEAPKGSGRSG